ncbi:MAG: lysophospholipid acyltransferase family protein [Pyrinomonadaceae bacterium]
MRTLIASLRLAKFVVATLGLYSFWFVARIFVRNKIRWRQTIFAAWAKSFVSISKMKIEVVGAPPDPPFFLVTNHLSYTDIAAICSVAECVFVAKAEVENWFLAGRICRDMGTVFIDRKNRRDIPRAGELIIERLDAGEGVTVFPEGTSTDGREVLPFNSSFLEFAARRASPVSYAAITYTTPDGEPPASTTVCWGENIGFFDHLWRLLHLRSYTAIITFGESPVTNSDRKLLAAELHHRVGEKFVQAVKK